MNEHEPTAIPGPDPHGHLGSLTPRENITKIDRTNHDRSPREAVGRFLTKRQADSIDQQEGSR